MFFFLKLSLLKLLSDKFNTIIDMINIIIFIIINIIHIIINKFVENIINIEK